jgi:hypothetical protein
MPLIIDAFLAEVFTTYVETGNSHLTVPISLTYDMLSVNARGTKSYSDRATAKTQLGYETSETRRVPQVACLFSCANRI